MFEHTNNIPVPIDSDEQPEILWHYTSIDVAFKILTKKQLRVTHNAFLNDAMEVHSGFETIIEVLRKETQDDDVLGPEDIKKFKKILKHTVRSPLGYYIISFSENKNLTTQWQAYTQPEGGCAIGFNFAILKEMFSSLQRSPVRINPDYSWWNEMPKSALCKCLYPTPNNEKEIHKKVITNINSIVQEKIDTKSLIENYREFFTCYVMSIKNSCFQQEDEWRLLFRPTDEQIQYDEKLRPYFDINIEREDIELSELISKIIVSSRGNRSASIKKLKFLRTAIDELKNISIIKSRLPLR